MRFMITATGREYHFTGPGAMVGAGRPICIDDIAHHLAQINRFTGACTRPYSVAEHSLLCSEIAQRANASLPVQMAALMHDAHEAYTTDLSSPAKRAVNQTSSAAGGTSAWTVFEGEHAKAVQSHFGLSTVFVSRRAVIREIDLQALATERRDLTAWRAGTHGPWEILGDDATAVADRVLPISWIDLDTPEREAMTWKDWRQVFLDRFAELDYGIKAVHGVAA